MASSRCPTCAKPIRSGMRFCPRCGSPASQSREPRDISGWNEIENRHGAKVAMVIVMVIIATAIGVGAGFQDALLALMIAALALLPGAFARNCVHSANALRSKRSRS